MSNLSPFLILYYVYVAHIIKTCDEEKGGKCLCGHLPITDHCVISNKLARKMLSKQVKNRALHNLFINYLSFFCASLCLCHCTVVGNCCVQHFGGELSYLSKSAFSALKSIKADPTSRWANESLLKLAERRNILKESGLQMYYTCMHERSLSENQRNYLADMNL